MCHGFNLSLPAPHNNKNTKKEIGNQLKKKKIILNWRVGLSGKKLAIIKVGDAESMSACAQHARQAWTTRAEASFTRLTVGHYSTFPLLLLWLLF